MSAPRLRGSPSHGGARRFNLPDIFQPDGTRRGAPFGAAGVHRTREYGGINPYPRFLKEAIFMGNHGNVIKSPPPCASPAPVKGSIAYAIPWNYLYCPHSELTRKYGVIANRGCLKRRGQSPPERQNCTKDFP